MMRRSAGVLFKTDVDPPTPVAETPVVRKRAEALGVDLHSVGGSGIDGRVRLSDLEASTAEGLGRTGDRAFIVFEAEVSQLTNADSRTELNAQIASALLEASGGRIAGLAIPMADGGDRLQLIEVPGAADLSVGGLTRAMRAVQQKRSSMPGPTIDSPVLTIIDAIEGAVLEVPVVHPETAMIMSIGRPELRVIAKRNLDNHAIAVRPTIRATVSWDPATLSRAEIAGMVAAVTQRLEGKA